MKASNTKLILVLLPLLSILFRLTEGLAEGYAIRVYPYLSSLQTALTRWFPFSVSDVGYGVLMAVGVWWLALLLFVKGQRWKALQRLLGTIVVLYSLFYLLWGINYSRPDFFVRNHLTKATTDTTIFKNYCLGYVEKLNRSFEQRDSIPTADKLSAEIHSAYQLMAQRYVVALPPLWPQVKPLLFSRLFAGMGINGYYGVLGGEPSVNKLIFPPDYPSAYAHEMSHALGVSSEAEANFSAYWICCHTPDRSLHFYGYYSVFRYLLRDAATLVSVEFARQLRNLVDPRIVELYRCGQAHYQSLYWEQAGEVQGKVYHSFLQSQGVKAGLADYSQVVSYLLATGE